MYTRQIITRAYRKSGSPSGTTTNACYRYITIHIKLETSNIGITVIVNIYTATRLIWTIMFTAEQIRSRIARSGMAMPAMRTMFSRRRNPSAGELAWQVVNDPSCPVFIACNMSRVSPLRH